jgi:hypothetical protein
MDGISNSILGWNLATKELHSENRRKENHEKNKDDQIQKTNNITGNNRDEVTSQRESNNNLANS